MLEGANDRRIVQILANAKSLAVEYYELTGKPLGVTGEVAEYLAAQALDLELAPPRTSGFDAIRQLGKRVQRIQIKGRAVASAKGNSQRLGTIKRDAECDIVMLVLLDKATLDLVEIWEASMSDVVFLLDETNSKARKRGSLAISTYRRKAIRVWSCVDQSRSGD